MDKSTQFAVKNRSDGLVIYSIPEDNIRREFHPGESKQVPYIELEKLSFQPGGRELMERYLQIVNTEVTSSLNLTTEPEYYLSEAEIRDLLLHGSQDAFLDCLDFAPVGVINLIKKMAVALPCNDLAKRKAIKEKTGFNVDEAIRHVEEEKEDTNPAEAATTTRRVQPETTSGRRTVPEYKVVSTQQ